MSEMSLSPLAFALIQYFEAGGGVDVERSADHTVVRLENRAFFDALLMSDERLSKDLDSGTQRWQA